MELKLLNEQGQAGANVAATDEVFGREYNEALIHQIVVAYAANARSGNRKQKDREEVHHTTKKPWRQKGTGRARAGSFASPLWRGGGVVFGPKPRDFSKKVNVQTRQLALRKAFSERLKAGEVTVVDDFKLDAPKTKGFLQVLAALQLDGSTLVVVDEDNQNLMLASRNVQACSVATADTLNTYQLLLPKNLVFTRGAFEKFEHRLAEK